MKKWGLVVLAIASAGCSSDNATSLSRDMRNINNEAIDSLMMVTSESRAKLAKDKVLKPYSDRMGSVERRMEIWLQNTEDRDVIKDTLRSESVMILLAEDQINKRRLGHELDRIQKLFDTRVKKHFDRMASEGALERIRAQIANDPKNQKPAEAILQEQATEEARKEWPSIHDIASGASLTSLKQSLEGLPRGGGKFAKLVVDFNGKQFKGAHPPNFKELFDDFDDRVKKQMLNPL